MRILFFQDFEDIGGICVRFDLGHYFRYDAVFVDYERGTYNAHADLAVELLFLPNAVSLYDLKLGVGKQYERKRVFFGKFYVRRGAVTAYSDDGGVQLFIFAVIRSERTRLPCTAGGIILRVKIKYYLFSSERGERHAFAFLIF